MVSQTFQPFLKFTLALSFIDQQKFPFNNYHRIQISSSGFYNLAQNPDSSLDSPLDSQLDSSPDSHTFWLPQTSSDKIKIFSILRTNFLASSQILSTLLNNNIWLANELNKQLTKEHEV